ncbi:MAG TPA: 16S rRNA (guanine(527)-N(7))-methyltransferase RsmG [Streptosporangiales bacterium]
MAERYADLLATAGIERGLLGPREAGRIWDRHLLPSAALAELVPAGASVLDVGSGAGLPGIPLAIARPDLVVTLLEPMQRRCAFLEECVAVLALSNVSVRRGRAEDLAGVVTADVVTARAVARLPRLVALTVSLCRPGGSVLAVKGETVMDELAELDVRRAKNGLTVPTALRRQGVDAIDVVTAGYGMIDPPTTAVRVRMRGAGQRERR